MSRQLARQAKWTSSTSITLKRLPVIRAAFGSMTRFAGRQLEPGVGFVDQSLNGVEVRMYRPEHMVGSTDLSAALVWMHGGGLIVGSHKENRTCSGFAAAAQIPVISVGYRLAPEHPFPAALDDLVAAVDGVRDGDLAGVDPERLVVGGQSAGGGLAAALAQRLFDDGHSAVGQILVYPMLDDRTAVRPDLGDREHKAWNKISNRTGWSAYLGTEPGQSTTPSYAVPARRADLTGLPPAWVGVGSADMFHDESVAYAERLEASGVDCETVIVPDAIHGFDALPGGRNSPEARQFTQGQHDFVRRIIA